MNCTDAAQDGAPTLLDISTAKADGLQVDSGAEKSELVESSRAAPMNMQIHKTELQRPKTTGRGAS